jgi:NADPH:quinone reductase-like Zn-dependent oxidoreductase
MGSTQRQIHSLVREDGRLQITLQEVPVPEPGPGEVLVRIEAAPINPSDLGLLFGAADMSTARFSGSPESPMIEADVPEAGMRLMGGRVGQSLAVGNEGAGTVVAAGEGAEAQALVGRVVGLFGGDMYAEYRCVPAAMCLPLRDGFTAEQGASCFVNPMTALGMTETMRMEGHKALVHTAAASNLGQMLNRICMADGVDLVNIVRREEQARLLRDLGAAHVVDSSLDSFADDLQDALAATGATLAFDATGGGRLASQILSAMERVAVGRMDSYSRYGSSVHKQVYIYGALDLSPTTLQRNFGFAWSLGGWLLPNFLARAGAERVGRMRQRVADELDSTFASHYQQRISLAEALRPEAVAVYGRQATGQKFLIEPQR